MIFRYVIIQPLKTLRSLLQSNPDPSLAASSKALLGTLEGLLSRASFKDAALIITGGAISEWKLGSLVNVQEQLEQPTSAFEGASLDGEPLTSAGSMDGNLKTCLTILLKAELERISQARSANRMKLVCEGEGEGNESGASTGALIEAFLCEKIKCLQVGLRTVGGL